MAGNRFTIFLAGIGVGAAALLLLAPKSGKETRRWLGKTSNRARKSANHWVDRGKAGVDQMRHAIARVA